ncbi:cytochrome c biogenesis protein CcsA [Rhodospirillum sp. A1_3_36]|uniref:cytochrome c biogenesis protein CcsA n=1 Tax=Rhodospirillum sp. A1_3_36 TaxID=3391666 RepID=UPI0039A54F19
MLGNHLSLHLIALAALAPATLAPLRREPERDGLFWGGLLLALAATFALAAGPALAAGHWRTSFSSALWASTAMSLLLYGLLCRVESAAWKLSPLLMPYLVVLGTMATLWAGAEGPPLDERAPPFWTMLHIAIALVTYALLTLAAIAALGGVLQERALKRKRPSHLTRRLPAAAEADGMAHALLVSTEVVLGAGLATGSALLYLERHRFFVFDHKTLLSWLAFLAIGGILLARRWWGVRGRAAARWMLLAYLLLTLAFLGVKFVTDIIL